MPERVGSIDITNKIIIFGWAGSSPDSDFSELSAENEQLNIEVRPEEGSVILSTPKGRVHKPISPQLSDFFSKSLPHDNQILRIQAKILELDLPIPIPDKLCSMAESVKNL